MAPAVEARAPLPAVILLIARKNDRVALAGVGLVDSSFIIHHSSLALLLALKNVIDSDNSYNSCASSSTILAASSGEVTPARSPCTASRWRLPS